MCITFSCFFRNYQEAKKYLLSITDLLVPPFCLILLKIRLNKKEAKLMGQRLKTAKLACRIYPITVCSVYNLICT